MKKKLAALLTLATLMSAFPMNCFAADQTVDATEGGTHQITASATVTDTELEALGLNVMVSFPTEVTLSLNTSTKAFAGTGSIYAYGILDSDENLYITIDEDHAAYGAIKYREAGTSGLGFSTEENYYGTVTETLSNGVYAPNDTLANYLKKEAGEDLQQTSTLSVSISGMIPTAGTGEYFTNVPLKIEIK